MALTPGLPLPPDPGVDQTWVIHARPITIHVTNGRPLSVTGLRMMLGRIAGRIAGHIAGRIAGRRLLRNAPRALRLKHRASGPNDAA